MKQLKKIESNWSWSFINDWSQIIGRFNWYSFHFVHLYFEYEPMVGEHYILECAFLGLGFTISYMGDLSPFLEETLEELEEQLNNEHETE